MKTAGSLVLIAALLTAADVSAQNSVYRYKTNNRNATEHIDAAVYNPAGLVWLADGVHVEIGNQLGFGTKTLYDGITGTTYEATGGSAFDPTAIVVYKRGAWATNFAFGASSSSGGEMEDGSPLLSLGGTAVAAGMGAAVNRALTDPAVGLPPAVVDPFTRALYRSDGGSIEERALDLGFMANVARKVSVRFRKPHGLRHRTREPEQDRRGIFIVATNIV